MPEQASDSKPAAGKKKRKRASTARRELAAVAEENAVEQIMKLTRERQAELDFKQEGEAREDNGDKALAQLLERFQALKWIERQINESEIARDPVYVSLTVATAKANQPVTRATLDAGRLSAHYQEMLFLVTVAAVNEELIAVTEQLRGKLERISIELKRATKAAKEKPGG
jgi:hypothetical protein